MSPHNDDTRPVEPGADNGWCREHAMRLAHSFQSLLGRPLLGHSASDEALPRLLYDAPFVLVSHGLEDDPVFNYANAAAQSLFELTWHEFVRLESRYSAESPEQAAREKFMQQVREKSFVDDYTGVRISSTGNRFTIDHAIVWNVIDGNGVLHGQAATFKNWTAL